MSSYEPATDVDLPVTEGELLVLLNRVNEDWLLVRSLTTGEEGYVPRIILAPAEKNSVVSE